MIHVRSLTDVAATAFVEAAQIPLAAREYLAGVVEDLRPAIATWRDARYLRRNPPRLPDSFATREEYLGYLDALDRLDRLEGWRP